MVATSSPARRAAFEILTRIDAGRGEPATLLHHPSRESLSGVDRDLMTEITYGVLRWRNQLDFVIAKNSKRPLSKIDAVPLTALRMGLYQLRFSSRVPPRAAVDESVKLVRAFGVSSSSTFVNAILRAATRTPDEPALPRKQDDPVEYLTTTLSHPRWLVERYLARLGLDAAESRCRTQNERPRVHVRVVPRVSIADAQAALASDDVMSDVMLPAPRALSIVSGDVRRSALYREGGLCIQDAGAQLVASLVDARADDLVLDMCSAPGGKATALAEMATNGAVLALDSRHRRTQLTRTLGERLGTSNLWSINADGTKIPADRGFARILLDAPCTSLGTLQRNPDIKWRLTEADVTRHVSLQRKLLNAAADKLLPGGRLVYATCSSEPEENEDVIRAFLADEPRFRLVPSPILATDEGFFETRPERDGTDSYFGAILTRD